MNASAFPAPRVAPNALHALGGMWRLASRRYSTPSFWLMLVGGLALLTLLNFTMATPRGVVGWVAGFYLGLIVPLLSFISSGSATRDDLAPASIDYVLTRPVPRPLQVLFRYLTQMACAQFDFLVAFGVIVAVGLYRGVPDLLDALPLLLLCQFLTIAVYSAAGVFCAQISRWYILLGLAYGALIELGIGSTPTQLNHISLLRHLRSITQPLTGDAGLMARTAVGEPLGLPTTLLILIAFIVAALAVSATLFSRKEFSGAAGKES